MFQLRKGFLPATVQAGLLLGFAAMLTACSEQPAPAVDAGPARVVASSEHGDTDLPVVTITAARELPRNEG